MALHEKLEVWGFEDGAMIFKDFSLGSILKLKPKDISCTLDDELNSLHSATCDFLNGLPSGMSLQFVQGIHQDADKILEKHNESAAESDSIVDAARKERISRIQDLDKKGEVPSHNLYLVVRKPSQKLAVPKKKGLSLFRKQTETTVQLRDQLDVELKAFNQALQNVANGLESIGVPSQKLGESEVFEILFDQWNPKFPLEGLNFNKEDIRDDLLLNDLVISHKGFTIGATHHRVLSLKIMPDQTFSSMAERMRDLPFDSRLFISIDVLDQAKETLALETQRRISYAMLSGKKGVSDLESAAKLRDIEALLARKVTGEEKIFSASLSLLLRHESEDVLDDQVQNVLQTFRELSGAEGMMETLAAAPIFFETAIPNARSKERARRMNTSVLADFLPIFGDWAGHENPRVLLRNRRGGLIGFDPFSPTLTNFNQVISGGSGSGKSFLTNILISQLMKERPKVFIIDIGGSYQKMCEHLGGQYVSLGTDSKIALNPFDLTDDSIEALDQKIKFMTSLVELMTKEDQALGIGKLERSEIERMIKEILNETPNPSLSHLRQKLLQVPELEKMGKILGPWCGDSPYGKFVDRPTNLQLNKNIVCFDLKGLESQPDLQAVSLFLIADLIWREVQKDRTNIKFVVFDECWKLLSNDAGSRLIGEIFRTFRKYRASAIAISQTMDDFAKSKVASAILPNASIKWILKQTGANLPALQESLLLNDREIKLVESVTSKKGYFSESFLIAGDDKQVVVIESTPLEYWLATTDPSDLKAYEIARVENPDLNESELLHLLAQKYPRGSAGHSLSICSDLSVI